MSTLNFQGSLSDPSFTFQLLPTSTVPIFPEDILDLATNFALLQKVNFESQCILISWEETGVYLINYDSVEIVGWYPEFKDIKDICVFGSEFFILHDNGKQFSYLSLSSPSNCLEKLVDNQNWDFSLHLLQKYPNDFINNFPILKILEEHFRSNGLFYLFLFFSF